MDIRILKLKYGDLMRDLAIARGSSTQMGELRRETFQLQRDLLQACLLIVALHFPLIKDDSSFQRQTVALIPNAATPPSPSHSLRDYQSCLLVWISFITIPKYSKHFACGITPIIARSPSPARALLCPLLEKISVSDCHIWTRTTTYKTCGYLN